MNQITRRTLLGTLLTAPAAFGQFITKPADQIVVDHAALVDIAMVHLNLDTVRQNPQEISQTPVGREIFDIVRTFNNDFPSQEQKVNLGSLFLVNVGVSFRVGNQSVIGIARQKIQEGRYTTMLQTGHEFGHLNLKHQSNLLVAYHPRIYSSRSTEMQRIQKTYAALFNQVDMDTELPLLKKREREFNPRRSERQAEEIAVKETCLSEMSLKLTNEALAQRNNRPSNMSQAEWNNLIQKIEGQREGSFVPLPPACGPKRRAMGLPTIPVLK